MKVVNDYRYLLTKQIRAKALGSSSISNQKKHGEHMLASDGTPVLSSAKSRDDFVDCLLQKVSTDYVLTKRLEGRILNLIFKICVQLSVSKLVDKGSAEDASKEERLDDWANVVAFATRLAYFHVQKKGKGSQNEEWLQEFYEKPHDEICDNLETNGLTVYSIAFIVHILMANLQVYSLSPDRVVSLSQKVKNGGRLAYMEIVLSMVLAGQCNVATRYGTDETHLTRYFDPRDAECFIRVPGIGLSQLDPRNVNALAFCYPILKDLGEDDMPRHNPAITAQGKHGRNAEYFFDKPVYLGGYPSMPSSNDAESDEEDDE